MFYSFNTIKILKYGVIHLPKFPFTYFDCITYLIVGLPVVWVLHYSKAGIFMPNISTISSTEKWVWITLGGFLVGQIISFVAHYVFQENLVARLLVRLAS